MVNRNASEDGTVLLSTLLVLSLMSAVALALLGTLRLSVERTATLQARAQADLYAQGASDFATAQMQRVAQVEGQALNAELMQADPIVLPFENGSIALSVADGTHCFRLSALSGDSTADQAQLHFQALMGVLGADPSRAERLAAAARDWVDPDSQALPGGAEDGTYLSRSPDEGGPHRTANVPMQSVTEVRALDDMDEALFRRLLPHLCIGTPGMPTVFNIDTAQVWNAPVLAAMLGGSPEAERTALDLIENRPSGGYGEAATLKASPAIETFEQTVDGVEYGSIVYTPRRITAETLIRYGDVQRAQLLAFEGVDNRRPTLAYRSWGREEFPSLALARSVAATPDEGDRER